MPTAASAAANSRKNITAIALLSLVKFPRMNTCEEVEWLDFEGFTSEFWCVKGIHVDVEAAGRIDETEVGVDEIEEEGRREPQRGHVAAQEGGEGGGERGGLKSAERSGRTGAGLSLV